MDILRMINDRFLKLLEIVMSISSIAIASMIFIGAIMRYILKMDFFGMEELVMIFAFWLYFVGCGYASHEDSHLSVDLISSYIKNEKIKHIHKIIKYGISLVICVITMSWCFEYVMWNIKMDPRTPVYDLPMVISQVSILVAFIIMTIYTAVHLIQSIISLRNKSSNSNGGE